MTLRCRTYTTRAYWPRWSPEATFDRRVSLDLVYNVWSQSTASDLSSEKRFSIVFMHGAQMIKESWNYYVELAFKQWGTKLDKVIAIDSVGQGDSALLNADKVNWLQSYLDGGRDIGMVVRDVAGRGELDGPVILAGHSMGAMMCLLAGIYDADLYSGIVAFDSVWSGADDTDISVYNQFLAGLAGKVLKRSTNEWASQAEYDEYVKRSFTAPLHPRIRDDTNRHNVYTDLQSGRVIAKYDRTLQVSGYVSAISGNLAGPGLLHFLKLPVAIVRGDVEDWNLPGSNETLAEILPKSEVVVVPGGGHLIPFQDPDSCFKAIVPFVEQFASDELEYRAKWKGLTPGAADITAARFQSLSGFLERMNKTGKRDKLSRL